MQQNPSSSALVVIEEDIPLADSREIARQLGIDHRSFYRMITDYQEEIEADFGLLRLEFTAVKAPGSRGVKYAKYALLTEDQTYAYMSYSQNTPQARECKRKLVKAFAEAREQIAQLTREQQAPQINSLWQRRLEIFYRETQIPAGYWCVFGMVGGYCFTDALRAVPLIKETLPDGSIGKRWCHRGAPVAMI